MVYAWLPATCEITTSRSFSAIIFFSGAGFAATLEESMESNPGATVFGYQVANPSDFGVVTFDNTGQPVAIDEKPADPKSKLAITGLYIYSADVLDITSQVRPSKRDKLEITDVNRVFLQQGRLRFESWSVVSPG